MRKLDVVGLHEEFFTDKGFVLQSSKMLFEKVFPHGKQVVFIHFSEVPEANHLEYYFGVRINEVEELIHSYLPTPQHYAENSLTLVQSLDKLGSDFPEKFLITNEEDLSTVISQVENYFMKTGFSWLDQMIQPSGLEKEILKSTTDPLESENLVYSAFRSTALSKLYNPDDYQFLRNGFLAQMNSEQMTPFTIAAYLQFIDYLDNLHIA